MICSYTLFLFYSAAIQRFDYNRFLVTHHRAFGAQISHEYVIEITYTPTFKLDNLIYSKQIK